MSELTLAFVGLHRRRSWGKHHLLLESLQNMSPKEEMTSRSSPGPRRILLNIVVLLGTPCGEASESTFGKLLVEIWL
jgi:hypothetical protein